MKSLNIYIYKAKTKTCSVEGLNSRIELAEGRIWRQLTRVSAGWRTGRNKDKKCTDRVSGTVEHHQCTNMCIIVSEKEEREQAGKKGLKLPKFDEKYWSVHPRDIPYSM